jgi:hypothetical protein
MNTYTDISALYGEFTDALTEVLAENAAGPARVAALQGLAPSLRSIPTITRLDIFWRWRPRSRIGRLCKTPCVNRASPIKPTLSLTR